MISSLLLEAALSQFHLFLLVLVRISGIALAGPLLGSASVPTNARILIIVAISLLVTPTLAGRSGQELVRWDQNGDQFLSRAEVPEAWLPYFDALAVQLPATQQESLPLRELTQLIPRPNSLLDLVWLAIGELSIGFTLGIGVQIVLGGLQLAGQIIDQQAGFSLGEIFNPDLDSTSSQSGQLLFLVGTVCLLCMEPMSGHLMMMQTLVQSFEVIPVGMAFVTESTVELVSDLVQVSLGLAIRCAAPVIITMSLMDLTLGFLGHSVPQINLQAVGFALRAMLAFFVLATIFPGLTEAFTPAITSTISQIRQQWGLES